MQYNAVISQQHHYCNFSLSGYGDLGDSLGYGSDIFGQKWIPAIPILILICLSVLPRSFAWASSLLLNAIDKTHITLYLDVIFTIIFAASILVAVKGGIFWVAVAVLISHCLLLPVFTLWTHRYVFDIYLMKNLRSENQ